MVLKRICIIGPSQCGSTRLFNLTRMLFELKHSKVFSGHRDDNKKTYYKYDIVVEKWHAIPYDNLSDYDYVLLPIRHLFDSAISQNMRNSKWSYKRLCHKNINYFERYENYNNKFVFFYEEYSLEYIKELCNYLNINASDDEIKTIMNDLNDMLFSKDIVKRDNHRDETYRKTLLSQAHNTSGGKSFKFLTEMTEEERNDLLSDKKIYDFLKKLNYI